MPEITDKAHFLREKNCFSAEEREKEMNHINCADIDGDTPLINAARKGNTEVVKFLVEVHADLNIANKKGKLRKTVPVVQVIRHVSLFLAV